MVVPSKGGLLDALYQEHEQLNNTSVCCVPAQERGHFWESCHECKPHWGSLPLSDTTEWSLWYHWNADCIHWSVSIWGCGISFYSHCGCLWKVYCVLSSIGSLRNTSVYLYSRLNCRWLGDPLTPSETRKELTTDSLMVFHCYHFSLLRMHVHSDALEVSVVYHLDECSMYCCTI